jgi:hypothetical protein
MFVARYVVDELPLPGNMLTMAINLPVAKNYTALLRRITYSLDVHQCSLDAADNSSPKIEIAIQSQDAFQVREGGQSYIGGIVIQPQMVILVNTEFPVNRYDLPAWGTRAFMALEQRYVVEGSQLAVTTFNYDGVDTMGLRIEYTQEKLSDLEWSQVGLR